MDKNLFQGYMFLGWVNIRPVKLSRVLLHNETYQTLPLPSPYPLVHNINQHMKILYAKSSRALILGTGKLAHEISMVVHCTIDMKSVCVLVDIL